VPHHPLIHKLEELGLDKYLLKWTSNEREQQVVVSGEKSSDLPVASGVLQGSLSWAHSSLSSMLMEWNQMVRTVVMFADDMVLYIPMKITCCYKGTSMPLLAGQLARLHL